MDPRGPLYLQVRARDGRDRPERAESREGRARSKGSRRAEPGPGDRGGRAVVRYSPVTSTRALTRAVLRPQPGAGASERAVKPDGVQQRLVGDMIQHFEQRVFGLVGMKLLQVPECVVAEHYHDLQRKPFYPALISYMSSGPMVAMVWEGPNMVCTSRA